MGCKYEIYPLRENGRDHCAMWIPKKLAPQSGCVDAVGRNDVYNIVMVENTKDMQPHWPSIVDGWQRYIKDKLTGRTNVYTFEDLVVLKRTSPDLMLGDIENGKKRNFSGVIRNIRDRLKTCRETNVQIFIISKNCHNTGKPFPESELRLLARPPEMTISVYVLGIGEEFPAQHCLELRSRMHNGKASDNAVFWGQESKDIIKSLEEIGKLLAPTVRIHLSIGGYILPGLPEKEKTFHLGEWVYFEESKEELDRLSLSVQCGDNGINEATPQKFGKMCTLFTQWNNVLAQRRCSGNDIPNETFSLMESFYSYCKRIVMKSLQSRETIRELRRSEHEFRSCMRAVRNLTTQLKEASENEVAEIILKSIPEEVYSNAHKPSQWKRYTDKKYEMDMKEFQQIYKDNRPKIMELPPPQPEECCRVGMTSTLSDLREENFHEKLKLDRFSLLKDFVISGIPACAPVRNAYWRNPWTLYIKHILVEPYAILSQSALEGFADTHGCQDSRSKFVQAGNDEKTKFNIIIPTIPANAAPALKPIVCSKLFAMMATYCILKNPNTVRFEAHVAGLACAWLKTVIEYPQRNRPEFVSKRLEDILSTAKLYCSERSNELYVKALINKPEQALRFVSTEKFEDKVIKSESLVKPAFFLFLNKESLSDKKLRKIFRLLVLEFFIRCLSKSRQNHVGETPFLDFFCPQLSTVDSKKKWIERECKALFYGTRDRYKNLLEKHYTLNAFSSCLRQDAVELVKAKGETFLQSLTIEINLKKICALKNTFTCGGITWPRLETLAQEFGLPFDTVRGDEVFVYVAHVLQAKDAKSLLSKELPSYEQALTTVKQKVLLDIQRLIRKGNICDDYHKDWEFEKEMMDLWRKSYLEVHSPLARPMTRQEIVKEARERGIEVSLDTFEDVFRYNEQTNLLRNACQIAECPHYLMPRKNFNQHLTTERKEDHYPHSFHSITKRSWKQGVGHVTREIVEAGIRSKNERKQKMPAPPNFLSMKSVKDSLTDLIQHYETMEE